MKKETKTLLALLLSLLMAFSFVACGNNNAGTDDIDDEDTDYTEDTTQNLDESEDVEVKKVQKPVEKFYGTWTATSSKAEYLYGNIEVTVKEDGTWTANITDEELYGTWTNEGDYLRMHDKTEIFDFSLAYSENNNLLFIDDEQENDINIVLTKK